MTDARSSWPATTLGLWWVANLAVYEAIIVSGWPVGRDLPQEYRVGLVPSIGLTGTLAVAVGLFFALVLLVEGWRLLESRTAMDPFAVANRSIRWAASVLWRARIFFGLSLVLPPLLFLMPEERLGLLIVPIVGVYLWSCVGIPLGVYQLEVLESQTGAGWWHPRWPGTAPIATAAGLSLLLWLFPWLPVVLAGEHSAFHLLWGVPMVLVVAVLVPPAIAAALVFRLSPWRAVERVSMAPSWRTVGPVVALNARYVFAGLFLLAPTAAIWFFLWQTMPVHAQWLLGRGLQLPATARALANSANTIGDYAPWWWALPSALVTCLMVGKLVHLLGTHNRLD